MDRQPGSEVKGAALSHFALHRSEEHTSDLQSQSNLVCRLLLEKKTRLQSFPTLLKRPLNCLGNVLPGFIRDLSGKTLGDFVLYAARHRIRLYNRTKIYRNA